MQSHEAQSWTAKQLHNATQRCISNKTLAVVGGNLGIPLFLQGPLSIVNLGRRASEERIATAVEVRQGAAAVDARSASRNCVQ